MSFGADGPPGQVDWLQTGPPPGPPGRRRRRILVGTLLAVLIAAVLGPALLARDGQDEEATSLPRRGPTPGPTILATSLPASPTTRPRVVHRSGPLLPGRIAGWQLYGRDNDTVYRIEVGAGRVTATYHGHLGASSTVTFIAGAKEVILRPLDDVSGVVGIAVPDGQTARPLQGRLAKGGYALPGPSGSVWVGNVPSSNETPVMRLVRFDGTDTKQSVAAETGYLRVDGAGGLLLSDAGGVWEARPAGMHRITTGGVAAVGPHHYLLVNCDARHACYSTLYDRRDQRERRLTIAHPGRWYDGVVSPTGQYAAFVGFEGENPRATLEIVDLRSGRTMVRTDGPEQGEVDPLWSPDGRWLASLTDGRLSFIDLRSGRRVTPTLPLPPLLQLAGRPVS